MNLNRDKQTEKKIDCPYCRMNLKNGLPKRANHLCCPQGILDDIEKMKTKTKTTKEFDEQFDNPIEQIDELVEMAKELKNDRGDDSGLTEETPDKYFDDREVVKDIKDSIIEQSK